MANGIDRGRARSAARTALLLGLVSAAGCKETPPADLQEAADGEGTVWRQYAPPAYPDTVLQDDVGPPGPGPSPYFKNGVVTTSEVQASVAGRKVLEAGGDAIDAAVVVQAMLNVVEPQSSGIGGGAIWLVYLADEERTIVIDCRERAPGKATPEMFADDVSNEVKSMSGVTVGVPGTLHCMRAALALRPGGLTMAEALQPAIDAATKGIIVSKRLAGDSHSYRLTREPGDAAYEEARLVFRPGGDALGTSDILKQPALAHTLKQIQQHGLAAFYDCGHPAGIAAAIVETQKAARSGYPAGTGRMTCSDLLLFEPSTDAAPLTGQYHGYTVVTTPPPSSGVHLLEMLGMLERFELGQPGYGFGEFKTMNVMQEAIRLAFADRKMWLGDPNMVKVPVTGLLAKEYIDARSSMIVPGKRIDDVEPGNPWPHEPGGPVDVPIIKAFKSEPEGKNTTHYVTSDGAGNIVSVSTTITDMWGTGLMVKDCGFLLNDQLLNFNDEPHADDDPWDPGANDVAPHKRPRTTLAPTLVFLDGKPIAGLGSPGGAGSISSILGFLINLADHRMTLQQAVAAPRFSIDDPDESGETEIEPGFSSKVRSSLAELGYDFVTAEDIGAVQAVIINPYDQREYGTADPRRIGAVEGLDK